MINISHEVPTKTLEDSRGFNDYDYCLVHLLRDKGSDYEKFYKKSVELGRTVFLDNSAFELEGSVDNDELIEGVKTINPTHVIAPDFLDDMERTLESTYKFLEELKEINYDGNVIAVIQGLTYEEYIQCYKIYDEILDEDDWIAFPFDIKCFHEEAEHIAKTRTQIFAASRNILLDKMISDGIISYKRGHHLLGCSDPVEFKHYHAKEYEFIKSVDTSCPIILAMFGEELPEEDLGKEKRKEKLADNLNYEFSEEAKELMYKNIETFKREYLRRE